MICLEGIDDIVCSEVRGVPRVYRLPGRKILGQKIY